MRLFAYFLFNLAIKLSSVSLGSFSFLLKQSRLRYFADAIPFRLLHYYTAIVCIFFFSIAKGFEHVKAIVISRVLEYGELIGLDTRGFPTLNQVISTVFLIVML